MRAFSVLLPLAFTALSSQSPTRRQYAPTEIEPCQEVVDYVAAHPSNSSAYDFVNAGMAYRCLTSIPFNSTTTISFIEGLKLYFQFQSTLAYLADPPSTCRGREAVNVMAEFDLISKTAVNGGYKNHYEFEAALRILLRRLHDGHVNWSSNCLEGLFSFEHTFPIVALAEGPDDIPKIYGAVDFPVDYAVDYNISAISKIDDVPVAEYLSDWIEKQDGSYHDADTRWNTLFYRRVFQGFTYGEFTSSNLYLGDNFTVTFENSTKKTVEWAAVVKTDLADLTSGEDIYASKCLVNFTEQLVNLTDTTSTPTETEPAPSTGPTASATAIVQASGYPVPIDIIEDGSASSYILDDGKTGVLLIPTFTPADPYVFQQFITSAISNFKALCVERVIIDVSGNGGGYIGLGFDTFKQFFPDIEPWGATNNRATPAVEVYYQVLGEMIENTTTSQSDLELARGTPFSYSFQRDPAGEYYSGWESAYGPVEHWGDNFTSLARWDYVDSDAFGIVGFNITNGDGHRNASYATPWEAKDVIILGDGICSSTCTSFTQAMKEAHVRTFVYGGRPQHGPMQMIGGVEGTQVYTFQDLYDIADWARTMHPEMAEEWESILPSVLEFQPYPVDDYTMQMVNIKNGFGLPSSKSPDTPLQFIYEAADYRVQMTEEYHSDISKLWGEVVSRVWGGEQ